MILGELLEGAAAPAIEPAITHVADDQGVIEEQRRDHGGAHPMAVGIPLRLFVDLQVRELDCRDQAVDVIAVAAIHLERPRQLLFILGRLEEPGDGLDGQLAGHLAGRMPSHAVGHDGQPLELRQIQRILVVGALHSHVGITRETDPHPV